MRIDVFADFNSELEKTWSEFETEAVCSPFQSYMWLSNWQNIIGAPFYSVQPQVVIVKEKGKLMAILPLGIRESVGILILEWLGGEQSDYMGPLLSKKWEGIEKDFPLCWKNVLEKLEQFDVIHLKKQRENIGVLRNPFVKLLSCDSNHLAYQANLIDSWDEQYKKIVKSKLRADSHRQRRRLSDIGELHFLVAESKEIKKVIISKMIDQKNRQYRFTVQEHKAFYEKLTDIQNKKLNIHCAALFVGDIAVATHVGIVDQNIFYYLMPAHEGGNWGKYSPGRLLLEHLMEWSIQNNVKVFDFTVGEEQYKKNWCDTEINLFETLDAFTAKGKVYAVAQRTKQFIKQWPWLGRQAVKINVWLKNESRLIGRR